MIVCYIVTGRSVTLIDPSSSSLSKSEEYFNSQMKKDIQKGKLTQQQADEARQRVQFEQQLVKKKKINKTCCKVVTITPCVFLK